ncbi:MAG: hypothetical protein ACYDIA_04085 [Candidatus Humimicrobiaceae bacterium]
MPRHVRPTNGRIFYCARTSAIWMNSPHTKLLCTHCIENKEQLLTYQQGLEQEMESLSTTRPSIANKIPVANVSCSCKKFGKKIGTANT